jgi:hypothetical protein
MRILSAVSTEPMAGVTAYAAHGGTHMEWLSLYLLGSVAMVASAL